MVGIGASGSRKSTLVESTFTRVRDWRQRRLGPTPACDFHLGKNSLQPLSALSATMVEGDADSPAEILLHLSLHKVVQHLL